MSSCDSSLPAAAQPSSSISDEQALQALLSSAEERERERTNHVRKDKNNNNNNNHNHYHPRKRREMVDDRNSGRDDRQYGTDFNKKRREQQPRWSTSGSNGSNGPNRQDYRSREDNANNNNRNNNRNNRHQNPMDHRDNYYGPAKVESEDLDHVGSSNDKEERGDDEEKRPIVKQKANFGISGTLTKDVDGGGNVYKGVVLKFQEPPEARAPNTQWRFYVFKGQDAIETLHVSKQSAYLIGRNQDICDIVLMHPSSSSQHAVLQYRALPLKDDPTRVSCQPYIMDLESTNGTFLNGVRLDSARYYQLKKGDVLKFGASTREYVLLTENTTSVK